MYTQLIAGYTSWKLGKEIKAKTSKLFIRGNLQHLRGSENWDWMRSGRRE